MFNLQYPHEQKMSTSYVAMVYGKPGVGKTTLAVSAKNPVILDFDRGLGRIDNPNFWIPKLEISDYQEVTEFLKSKEIDMFDTIIIDTVSSCVDCMTMFLLETNQKIAETNKKSDKISQSNGALTLRGFSELRAMIANFTRLLRSKNKNVIFVAHEKEEDDGEAHKVIRPDLGQGSGGRELIKFTDILGYMSIEGGKTMLTVKPYDDKIIGKNSFGLPNKMEISNPNDIGRNVWFQSVIDKFLEKKADNVKKMRTCYDDICDKINSIIDEDTCNDVYKFIVSNSDYANVIGWKKDLQDKVKSIGLIFNKEKERFESPCIQ